MKKQLEFDLYKGKIGGRRPGAGRKRIHSPGVAHTQREKMLKRTPQYINFKFICRIRNKESLKILKRAILKARQRGLNVIHFSLQSNHIHPITEADSNSVLTAGMRALTITFAKGLKKGRVQLERYHLHVLKSVRETKNALNYFLFNEQKHHQKNLPKISNFSSNRKTYTYSFAFPSKNILFNEGDK